MDAAAASSGGLNPDASRLLRFAAGIGMRADELRDVTFSGLLTALLFASIVDDRRDGHANLVVAGSIDVSSEAALWREAQRLGIAVDTLLEELRLDEAALPDVARIVDSEPPSQHSFAMSPSASHMVFAAGTIARARSPEGLVGPVELLGAYLLASPTSHLEQMRRWGFTPEAIGHLQRRFGLTNAVSAPSSADGDLPPLPGFDPSASAIIRLAWVLTSRRRDGDRPITDLTELMVAAAEIPTAMPQHARPELVALRDALSLYNELRERYALLLDTEQEIRLVDSMRPAQTRRAQAIQASAQAFAQAAGAPMAMPRHLLAALLTEDDGTNRSPVDQWIAMGHIDQLRDALARIVADRYPRDNAQVWADRLVGPRSHLVTTVQPDTIPRSARALDQLELRGYSDAIGALIAAKAQTPPLSIAVFGPWGSGKSFFMRMIQEAASDFVEAGSRAAETGRDSPFHQRIVQIEFNAWHYAEANLWASLVHAILEGLQQALSPERNDGRVFERLLSDLSISQAAESEARARLVEAEARKAEAEAAFGKAQTEAIERREVQQRLAAEDVLDGLRATVLGELRPRAGSGEGWVRSIGAAVVKAAEYVGRPELAASVPALQRAADNASDAAAALQTRVGDLEDILNEARASARQGSSVLAWLANARFSEADRHRLMVRTAGFFALFLVLAVLLQAWGGQIAGWIGAGAALIAPILVAFDTVIGWARRNLSDASRAFALLESVRDRVEGAKAERLSRHEVALQAAHRAASEAEADAARRRADLEAAEVARKTLEAEVKSASSAEQMKRFIASRLADGDYQRHLGLLHTIRCDVERLGRILADVQGQVAGAEPPIRRIVLYVDDLDRCPPARVVEVLESVHLLLAFPLFVVVVGVDIRWVSQALRERYPQQLSGATGLASPVDYLEKVFQIPFWLPPMDAIGGERLLAAAIGAPEAPLATDRVAEPAGRPLLASDHGAMPADNMTPVPATLISADTGGRPEPEVLPAGRQIPTEALTLTDGERRGLIALASAVGISPRRAKRFANLYRLLKASLSPAERRGFVLENGRDGSFGTAMALLAATTGAPITARRMLTALGELSAAEQKSNDAIGALLDSIAVHRDERRTWASIRAALPQRPYTASDVTELQFWAPRIYRFCFNDFDYAVEQRSEHASEGAMAVAPGE